MVVILFTTADKYVRIRIRRRPAWPFPRDSCDFSNGFWSRSPSSGVCACRPVDNPPPARAATTAPAPARLRPPRPPPPDDGRWTSANRDRGNPTSRRWLPWRVVCSGLPWTGIDDGAVTRRPWYCADRRAVCRTKPICRLGFSFPPLARKSPDGYYYRKIKKTHI